jgi:hypothetical protein
MFLRKLNFAAEKESFDEASLDLAAAEIFSDGLVDLRFALFEEAREGRELLQAKGKRACSAAGEGCAQAVEQGRDGVDSGQARRPFCERRVRIVIHPGWDW